MMQIHEKTKKNINQIIKIIELFLESYNTTAPDIRFIHIAFADKIKQIKNDIFFDTFKAENYHNDIYDFDNILSAWSSNLTYNISDESNANSMYDVLFSSLQAIDSILEQDYNEWDAETLLDTEHDNEENHIERCIPD